MSINTAEQGLLHKLFRENSELRIKVHNLNRELFNKSLQIENVEEELRAVKKLCDEKDKLVNKATSNPNSRPSTSSGQKKNTALLQDDNSSNTALLETINSKNLEIQKLDEEIESLKTMIEQKDTQLEQLTNSLEAQTNEIKELKEELMSLDQDSDKLDEEMDEDGDKVVGDGSPLAIELEETRRKLKFVEENYETLKKQLLTMANESNRKNNDLQNQLQGVESLVEGLKREYDEFLEVSKLENDSARALQQQEYEKLRHEHENLKINHNMEKRKLLSEFRGILYSMQSQFEEYKTTSEFMFNIEISKLEDEVQSQAQRFEHELIYTVQAKDKFYSEMMIAKDAKIMNLIEGSDLQSVLQKQENDLESLRKEHAREMARIKDERDSEQKNFIANLQKHNQALEVKYDKLQLSYKSLDGKLKEMTNSLEVKNRLLHEKDEAKAKLESEHQLKLDALNDKIAKLAQEKEHLRHRIIRMSMDAKGEGENNIENMLKRLVRETNDLHKEYDNLSVKHKTTSEESEVLKRRVREKDRFVNFLEKEIHRRNEEISNLTRTFERFLLSRTNQLRHERKEKAKRQQMSLEEVLKQARSENAAALSPLRLNQGQQLVNGTDQFSSNDDKLPEIQAKVRFNLPKTLQSESNSEMALVEKETIQNELDQGLNYLKRFKAISKVFALNQVERYMAMAAMDPSNPDNGNRANGAGGNGAGAAGFLDDILHAYQNDSKYNTNNGPSVVGPGVSASYAARLYEQGQPGSARVNTARSEVYTGNSQNTNNGNNGELGSTRLSFSSVNRGSPVNSSSSRIPTGTEKLSPYRGANSNKKNYAVISVYNPSSNKTSENEVSNVKPGSKAALQSLEIRNASLSSSAKKSNNSTNGNANNGSEKPAEPIAE